MNIAHVITFVDPQGSFGGPLRVAINQVNELRARGHTAEIIATAKGYSVLPKAVGGAPTRLFRAHKFIGKLGFSGIYSISLIIYIFLNARKYDAIHVHLTRDLVTLPVARIAILMKVRLILQTHGMVDRSQKLLSKPLDRILTNKVIQGSSAMLYLTELERQKLLDLFPSTADKLTELVNGVPLPSLSAVVGPFGKPEVLFLARLHARKRPVIFVEVAKSLTDRRCGALFTLVGPDGGQRMQVQTLISDFGSDLVTYEGALPMDAAPARIAQSSIYVLPSVNEPFPMSVLEAMAAGKPVIVTESCGLATFVRKYDTGIVVAEDPASLEEAVQVLLENPALRTEKGNNGRELAQLKFSMRSVGSRLESIYLMNSPANK